MKSEIKYINFYASFCTVNFAEVFRCFWMLLSSISIIIIYTVYSINYILYSPSISNEEIDIELPTWNNNKSSVVNEEKYVVWGFNFYENFQRGPQTLFPTPG